MPLIIEKRKNTKQRKFLSKFQKKYKLLINDPYQLNKILDEGKEKAEDLANQTLKRVKSKLGFFEMEK